MSRIISRAAPSVCVFILLALLLPFSASAAAPPVDAPTPFISEDGNYDVHVEQVIQRTNAERLAHGLAPLQVSARLTQAARIQANQMARAGTMAHALPSAPFPALVDRARAVSYTFAWLAENIAYGYRSPSGAPDAAQVMDGWMNSSGHRNNILSNQVSEVGVAIASGARGELYYASVFGAPR